VSPENLLVIGAHIGDADVMAGALAAHVVKNGGKATFLHLTYGEKGKPGVPPETYKQQKIEEAKQSAKILGVDVKFMGYEDGNLSVSNEVAKKLAVFIRDLRPTVIITHWMGSTHQDHAATHYLAVNAVEYAGSPEVEGSPFRVNTIYFAENVEDPYFFYPTVFVDVSDAYETYVKALNVHEYVRQSAYGIKFLDYYPNILKVRGASIGAKYAVALAEKPQKKILSF